MSDTLRSTMSWDLVFVGCGRAKRQHEARARDLYTGPVFRAHWAILQHLAIWPSVLSAEHGVIEHGAEVEPYQREIGDGRHFIAGPVPLQTAREKKSGQVPIAPRERWCDAVLRVVLTDAARLMRSRDCISLPRDPAYDIKDMKQRWAAMQARAGQPIFAFGPPQQPAVLVLAGVPYIDCWADRARAAGVRVDDPLRGYDLLERRAFARRFVAETPAWECGEQPEDRGYTRAEQLLSFVADFELERALTMDDVADERGVQLGLSFWEMTA